MMGERDPQTFKIDGSREFAITRSLVVLELQYPTRLKSSQDQCCKESIDFLPIIYRVPATKPGVL